MPKPAAVAAVPYDIHRKNNCNSGHDVWTESTFANVSKLGIKLDIFANQTRLGWLRKRHHLFKEVL